MVFSILFYVFVNWKVFGKRNWYEKEKKKGNEIDTSVALIHKN